MTQPPATLAAAVLVLALTGCAASTSGAVQGLGPGAAGVARMTVGERVVLTAVPPQGTVRVAPDRLRLPGHEWRVTTATTRVLDVAGARRQAPAGHTAVVVAVVDEPWQAARWGSLAGPPRLPACAPRWEVRVGAASYPLPDAAVGAVVVPGDGGDARVALTCGGVVQELGADGRRTAWSAPAFFLHPAQPPVAHVQRGRPGDPGVALDLTAAVTGLEVTAWDRHGRPAPAGQVALRVEVDVAVATLAFTAADGRRSRYRPSVSLTAVRVAGATQRLAARARQQAAAPHRYTLDVLAPARPGGEVTVELDLDIVGQGPEPGAGAQQQVATTATAVLVLPLR